jgi:hypothetical protein
MMAAEGHLSALRPGTFDMHGVKRMHDVIIISEEPTARP